MTYPIRQLLLLLSLFLLAGCASTPEKRIAREPELFAGFPPEIQEQIREGTIALGFTPEMVRLALGEPDRIVSRQTTGGRSEFWIYLGSYLVSDTYTVRDFGRFSRGRYGHIMVDQTRQEFYEQIRLEFRDGMVVAADQLVRR